jgi:xanthine dehydrogenase large subunit
VDGQGIVRTARLAYGGVAPTPVRARKTEQALLGQRWNHEAIERVRPILESEFTPISDVRGSAEYRRGLIVSLFQKFCSGELSHAQDKPLTFELNAPWPVSHETKALKHDSGVGHVTGGARYVDDGSRSSGHAGSLARVCAPCPRADCAPRRHRRTLDA